MTIAIEINKLIADGTFKVLIAGGIISPNVLKQYEIYNSYTELRCKKSGSVRDIVSEIAEKHRVSESTAYAAIKVMRQETGCKIKQK